MTPAAPQSPSQDPRFLLEPFEPAYLSVWRSGDLKARVAAGLQELTDCCACPRDCHVNRCRGRTSVCKTGRHAAVANAFPHFGEESCLRGTGGSGTIFFAFCNLRCVFCQNWDISQAAAGEEMSAQRIADLALDLQKRGCHNINFVTPEHVVPQILETLAAAIPRGLRLPIVYNSSGYDSVRSLRLLDGLVDIYMPDFKFWKPETSRRLAKVKDYPQRAREAIAEMHRQVGSLKLGPRGVARRGVLLRHLVMPGLLDESRAIFEWLATEISPDTFVNVMAQYRPAHEVGTLDRKGKRRHADIDRKPRTEELQRAHEAARKAGLWRLDHV